MKVKVFPKDCSPQSCKEVGDEVRSRQLSKDTTIRHPQGGLAWTVLEPATIHYAGEPAGTRHRMSKVGMAVKFKRCQVYEYIDNTTKKREKRTCTDTSPKAISIPRDTVNCYQYVSDFLEHRVASKKGGRPSLIKHKILAAVACRSAIDQEPMTPMLVSAMISGGYSEETYSKVRNAMDDLVASGKIKVTHPTKYRKTRLKIVGEEEHRVPNPYLKDFRDFIKGEVDERTWAGMRRMFGKEIVPTTARQMPEPTIPRFWFPAKGFKPKKLGKRALEKERRDLTAWAIRTGLTAQLVPIRKHRKPTKAEIVELGGKPTGKMRELGFK